MLAFLSVLFITLYKIINIFLSKVTHVDLLMIVALSYLLANANWMLKCKKKKKSPKRPGIHICLKNSNWDWQSPFLYSAKKWLSTKKWLLVFAQKITASTWTVVNDLVANNSSNNISHEWHQVIFLYSLFIYVKSLIDIKNGFFKRELARRPKEMGTNIT